ncbi:hypothetical protein Lal_00002982 [Lupinus albus]|nr:hypothetical protein Lal_00002982 [Lupinus albus]
MDSWVQEREEIRIRMELNEARTQKAEELLAAIALKLGGKKEKVRKELIVESVGSWDPCNLSLSLVFFYSHSIKTPLEPCQETFSCKLNKGK